MRIRWQGTFEAAHFIPGHPKCGRLHGHSYRVEVEVAGDVSPAASPHYLMDYGEIKRLIDGHDHVLLLATRMNGLTIDPIGEVGSGMVHVHVGDGRAMDLRAEEIRPLPILDTSAEDLSGYLATLILDAAPAGVRSVMVRLSETGKTWAESEAIR